MTASLPVATFVSVAITVNAASVTAFSFGTPMGVFEHTVTDDRQNGPYSTLSEAVDDGFTSSTEPYKWLSAVFAQSPRPPNAIIGRKVPAAGEALGACWQVDGSGVTYTSMLTEANDATDANVIVFPAMEDTDDWFAIGHLVETFSTVTFDYANGTAGIGGTVTWQYFSGTTGDWADIPTPTDNTTGFTAAAADGLTLTFTAPADWVKTTVNSVEAYYIRAKVSGAYTTNPVLDQIYVGGDATYTAALDAIEADDPESWYATNIDSRLDTYILQVAAWMESRRKIFIAQSDDIDILTDGAGNIAEDLKALGYNRTALIYHALDTEYLDGAWTGRCAALDLDSPGGVGTWGLKQLAGVTVDSLSTSQATAVWSNGANVYGRLKGLSFTAHGKMASGRYIDIQTTNDWFQTRLEEEILATLVGAGTKIPYTQEGLDIVGTAIQTVCNRGVTYGHFSSDTPPVVTTPIRSQVAAADVTARLARYTVDVVYAGAVQAVTINVYADFS